MTLANVEENQGSNEPESSEEEDSGFVGKMMTKDQYKLHDNFRANIDSMINYLQVLKTLTDAIQSICLSGKSYHVDQKTEVQNSGWRYMPNYMKKVEFVKNNQSEAESLWRMCDKLGQVEEYQFYDIFHVVNDSNIYYTASTQKKEIDKLNSSVELLIKTCNRRRKKVEKALILKDLQDQGVKYQQAVVRLDEDTRSLSNLHQYLEKNGTKFHRDHIKHSLTVIHRLATIRSDLINDETKKRQNEKAKSRKSTKVRDRTLKK